MRTALALAVGVLSLVSRAELVSERTGGVIDPTGVEWTPIAAPSAEVPITFYSAMCPPDAAVDAEGYATSMPRDVALYGSNDGKTWELVDEEAYSVGWTPGERRYWRCARPGNYARYRIDAPNAELYAPVPRSGATYYVDAEKGDDARTADEAQRAVTPWRTISRAAEAMIGGDTVLVAPGTYRETISIGKGHAAGTAVDRMTFKALDSAKRPVIDGAELLDPSGWRATTVTNFQGREIACLVREIDWKAPALFAGTRRLVVAHEPEQYNGDDPYELEFMYKMSMEENPDPFSKNRMVDSAFFTQPERDYWIGGTLKIYDVFSNTCEEKPIVGYDPVAHAITTETFTQTLGANRATSPDLWTICNHLGVLDAPGEYVVVGDAAPYRLYFIPPAGLDLATLSATRYANGFSLEKGGVTIDGFEFRAQSSDGIYGKTKPSRNLLVRNCRISHVSNGVNLRFWNAAGIERCEITGNINNGLSFANCTDAHVFDCSISTNGNNGIWSGTGSSVHYNDFRLTVRNCDIFDQAGRRSHADNYQIHQNDWVVIAGNRFTQQGEQNGWCQYTGHMIFCDNVFTGGPFGFGSVRYAEVAHNVFDSSTLRFDAHLTDHPEFKDYYCPVHVDIFANVIRTSSISYPSADLVDRNAAFDVRGNCYLFNSESPQARKTWDFIGRELNFESNTVFVCTTPVIAAPDSESLPVELETAIRWSAKARGIALYRDPDNFYWWSLSGQENLFGRRTNGVDVVLATKTGVGLPHGGPAVGTNRVSSAVTDAGIRVTVVRDESDEFTFLDTDPAVREIFTGPLRAGVWSSVVDNRKNFTLRHAVVGSSEYDFATTDGWTAECGSVGVASINDYSGVGLGEGSVVISTNPVPTVAEISADDLAAVVTPDGRSVGPRIHTMTPADEDGVKVFDVRSVFGAGADVMLTGRAQVVPAPRTEKPDDASFAFTFEADGARVWPLAFAADGWQRFGTTGFTEGEWVAWTVAFDCSSASAPRVKVTVGTEESAWLPLSLTESVRRIATACFIDGERFSEFDARVLKLPGGEEVVELVDPEFVKDGSGVGLTTRTGEGGVTEHVFALKVSNPVKGAYYTVFTTTDLTQPFSAEICEVWQGGEDESLTLEVSADTPQKFATIVVTREPVEKGTPLASVVLTSMSKDMPTANNLK